MWISFMKSDNHYWEWLKDGWLFLLFIGWPAVVFGIAYLIFGYKVQTWHMTAYAMQLGAFTIFIIRLNSLYRNYDSEGLGYIGAIKRWLKRFGKRPNKSGGSISMINDPQTLSAHGIVEPPKNASIEESIEWLKQQFRQFRIQVIDMKAAIDNEINLLKSEMKKESKRIEAQLEAKKIAERRLQLPNLGRELVAVLWLMSAVLIFAITG